MRNKNSSWLIAAVLVIGGLGAALALTRANAAAQAAFEHQIAQLAAKGEPTRIEDLARKPPLPEENAATFLRRASEAMQSIDKEVSAAYENQNEDEQEAIDRGRFTSAYVKAVREALAAYPQVLELVRQAAACPGYDAQLDYDADTATFMDELVKQSYTINRRAMRMLRYQAEVQLADGDVNAALKTALTMLALCRHFDAEPSIVGALVAIACRGVTTDIIDLALRSGDVSDELRDELDAELERSNLIDVYRRGLVSDRAFGLDVLRERAEGKQQQSNDGLDFSFQFPAAFHADRSHYLDYMQRLIDLIGRPYSEIISDQQLANALNQVDERERSTVSLAVVAIPVARCEAQLRALRILNAIQRFETAHPGEEPTLGDLGLPAEVTTDPFNGQPMHVSKQPGGWLIYGVGQNLKDDGGKVFHLDSGFGPLPRVRDPDD